ncbi:uncharacterized protein CELE_K09E3.2 [Caenorhabditis elegans]|uniref:Uncharacterized protein n=1 Tax=Caenorhabditis elegans TaxID=6239 RepID=Q21398_CAEEL|nr:Uncharacterized protein CELE_K09E3.2 [Caenorhabditis elegans]CCD63625.1 Uncharacterized protein CELE_K09E3.2 [Caenorhabditis elegans]|eukprot:NP_510772.1 Uncharacterized protein CELE_K09E3.2 [Caenorhabditis elegans]
MTKRCVDDDRTLAMFEIFSFERFSFGCCCFLAHDDDGSLAGQLRDFFSSENRCPLLAHQDDGTLANFVIFSFIRFWLLAHDNDRDTDQPLHTLRHPLVFNRLRFGFPRD